MIVIKRGRVTFYIKEESIIVSNGNLQHLSFNVYGIISKSSFYHFKEAILNSKPPQFSNIIEVVQLGSDCGIYGVGSKKPDITNVEHEFRD